MPLDQPTLPEPSRLTTDVAMPLGDHLEELRRRIVFALFGLAAGVIVAAVFGFRLVSLLATPLLQAQDALGFPPQLITTEPTAGFTSVYMPVVLIAGAIVACPWIFLQFWKFVSVGLYAHERKAVYVLVPFSSLLAFAAVAFTYFVLLPVSLLFFMNFATFYPPAEIRHPNPVMRILIDGYRVPSVDAAPDVASTAAEPPTLPVLVGDADVLAADLPDGSVWLDPVHHRLNIAIGGNVRHLPLQSDRLINPLPQFGRYIRFASFMTLAVTLAFQLPVVMLVLGRARLLDRDFLARQRRYAVLVIAILAAVATPADPISMLALAVPLYGLFELGLRLMPLRSTMDHQADGTGTS